MSTFEIRPLRTAGEMSAASAVYRHAFGYAPAEASIPPKLLLTLGRYGGVVLGAFRPRSTESGLGGDGSGSDELGGDELVGFCYGFLARDPVAEGSDGGLDDGLDDGSAGGLGRRELYLFSQTAAILPGSQDSGLGRRLKWAQRDWALANGLDLIRWTFDPLRTRNAHVNFDVLGASCATMLADYYGTDTAGRDSGLASDRLLVDWRLSAPARPRATAPDSVAAQEAGQRVGDWLAVPAEWDGYRERVGPDEAQRVRLAVRGCLASAFAAGQRVISCQRVSTELAAYQLI